MQAAADQPHSPDDARATLVERFADRIPTGGRVLVLGVTDGEDVLALARRGLQVTAIDPIPSSVAELRQRAAAEGLTLDLRQDSFLDCDPPAEPIVAVVVLRLLSHLPRTNGARLFYRLMNWTAPGGLLLLTARHVDDPAYDLCQREWTPAGLHCFRSADGSYRTFLGRREILDLLLGWEIIYHDEQMDPPGDRGRIEVAAIKRQPARSNR